MRIKYSQRAYSFPITGNNASMIVSPPNSIAHKSSNSLDCCFYFMSEFQTMFRRYFFFLYLFLTNINSIDESEIFTYQNQQKSENVNKTYRKKHNESKEMKKNKINYNSGKRRVSNSEHV